VQQHKQKCYLDDDGCDKAPGNLNKDSRPGPHREIMERSEDMSEEALGRRLMGGTRAKEDGDDGRDEGKERELDVPEQKAAQSSWST
jgi:hypothetical protein